VSSGRTFERKDMKLEKQVCTLELAKRLKVLGVKQGSHFYWVKNFDAEKGWRVIGREQISGELDAHYGFRPDEAREGGYEMYAAFTVAELGEMLPLGAKSWQRNSDWACETWKTVADGHDGKIIVADTEADARAKMLVYLIENKLLSA
jgi:hypothetical protein